MRTAFFAAGMLAISYTPASAEYPMATTTAPPQLYASAEMDARPDTIHAPLPYTTTFSLRRPALILIVSDPAATDTPPRKSPTPLWDLDN